MSQISEEQNPAVEAGKEVAKKTGKKVAKKVGKKAGQVVVAKLGWPVILSIVGIAAILIAIVAVTFILMFSVSNIDEQTTDEALGDPSVGYYGGEISNLGAKDIPKQYIPIYKAAEKKYGVPWNLLAGHHRVETRFSTIAHMVSPVGATGHMQFMPCTWVGWSHPTCSGLGAGNISKSELTNKKTIAKYGGFGVDADGDGKADPDSLKDAIFGAASYLKANGAADGNIRQAVFAYNHASWYVEEVLGFADSYVKGYKEVDISGGSGSNGGGKSGVAVADVGRKLIGKTKYVFGGGRSQSDIDGGRFDCSSFVHWAFKQTGVDLGPLTSVSTETLKHLGKPISPKNIKPGDVVFFDTYKIDGHVGIYVGNGKFIGAQSSTGVAIADMSKGHWKSVFNGRVNRIGG